jgi:hypothetical protein
VASRRPPARPRDQAPKRRRPRRGTLERPVNGRLYRAAWAALAFPLLVAAFTVTQPEPLPAPRLEPSFDETTARGFASDLTRLFPDRSPGSPGGDAATRWVADRLDDFGLEPVRDEFTADVPGIGERPLVNLAAIAPGRSPETIVVVAHRDNSGEAPGANDNASGTAALLEIARNVEVAQPARTLLFLSTDGGAFGGIGAERFARRPELVRRLVGGGATVVAVVGLDAIAGGEPARVAFTGDNARSPSPALVATLAAAVAGETERVPQPPSSLAQLLDLSFPFTLTEQGPFVARGIPAVTLTTGGERAPPPEADTLEALRPRQLGSLGRAAQEVVLALDATSELARGTESYIYTAPRLIRGWTIQLLLFAGLIPFLVAVVDVFARCRRRRVELRPALRSLLTRFGVVFWTAVAVALWSASGFLPGGEPRPISPDSEAAGDWPVLALVALAAVAAVGWLFGRPRIAPRGPTPRRDALGGYLAAMLVLGVVGLVVAATNPYALVFLLPSLHAWLWLPHVPRRAFPLRVGVFLLGLAGPVILVASFAVRYGLGFDAPWYVLALVSVGYVAPAFLLAALVWAAVALQVGALAFGRYGPYVDRRDRPARGPIRGGIRRLLLARRPPPRREERLRVVGDE